MILEQLTQMQNKVAQCTVSCMDVYLCGMLITDWYIKGSYRDSNETKLREYNILI